MNFAVPKIVEVGSDFMKKKFVESGANTKITGSGTRRRNRKRNRNRNRKKKSSKCNSKYRNMDTCRN